MKRATKRPSAFKKPSHWSDTPPPEPAAPEAPRADDRQPTRYGDWERDGIAVDF